MLCLRIFLIFICLTFELRMAAQFIERADNLYFGPGLVFPFYFSSEYYHSDKDSRYWLDGRYFSCVFLDVDYFAELEQRKLFNSDNCWYISQRKMFDCDSIGKIKESKIKSGAFDYKLIKTRCIDFYGEKKRIRRSLDYYVILDTIIQDVISVSMIKSFATKRKAKKALAVFSNIRVVDIADYPANALKFASNNEANLLFRYSGCDLFQKQYLMCKSPEDIRKEFPELYSNEIDSLFEKFDYDLLSEKLIDGFVKLEMSKWIAKRDSLQSAFDRYGEMNTQREFVIEKKCKNLQIGLNEFMNYKNNNGYIGMLDTLAFLKIRRLLFPSCIYSFDQSISVSPWNFDIKSTSYERFKINEILFENKVRLNVSQRLPFFIYHKYLKGTKDAPMYCKLLDEPHGLVYSFLPDDESLEIKILVTITDRGMGNWDLDVDTLSAEAYRTRFDDSFFFNGLPAFRTGSDYLIMDTLQGHINSFFFQSYPDTTLVYPLRVQVNSNEELLSSNFSNYIIAGGPRHLKRIEDVGPLYPGRSLCTIRDYEPQEVIYRRKEEMDLNQDGITDILSYGISNGQLVFCRAITLGKNGICEVPWSEVSTFFESSLIFRNIMLFSQIGYTDGK
jgi:hypothetical protein